MKIKQINKAAACPVSFEQVDKKLVKVYSSFILAILVLSLFMDCKIGIYFITVDFLIRVFIGIKYSPLCIIVTKSMKIAKIQPLLIDSGRKKIAAYVGLLFSVLISITFIFDYYLISKILTSIFIFAISLELIFDYCLACKMQSLYFKFFKK